MNSVGRSSLSFLFTKYTPVEPRLGLVRRYFHQHFNQPLSYKDPIFLLQLLKPATESWKDTPKYQQILRDSRNHIMDQFPSLFKSDMNLPHEQSIGVGPSIPHSQ